VTVNKRGLLTGFKWFSIWLIASVALTAIVIEVVDPRYLFNDDMVIAAVASGDYTGTPDPHTLNGGALLSVVVATLYGFFPGVAWWLWVLEFLLLGSLVALLLVVYRATTRLDFQREASALLSLTPAVGIFVLFVVTWIFTPTWTVVAFAPGMAAILIATVIVTVAPSNKSIALWAAVGVLAAMVGLVRSGPFSFLAFVAASALVWISVVRHTSWSQRAALVTPPLVLLAANFLTGSRLYSAEPWRTGKRLFEQTHILVDTYLLGALTPIGLSQGWRGYEIGFASARYFVPSDAFTVNSFESFIDAANPYRIGLWAITPPSIETLNNVINATRAGWSVALVGLAIALAVLIYSRQATKLRVGALLLSASIGISVILFLGFIRNNPGHVALPMGFVAAVSSLGLVSLWLKPRAGAARAVPSFPLWLSGVSGVVAILLTYCAMKPYQVPRFLSELDSKQNGWLSYEDTFETLKPGCPVFGVNIGFELAPAKTITPPGRYPLVLVMWNSLTPLTEERLKLLGFEKWDDLFAEGACTYFMGGGDYANAMTEYARDRGGVGEFVRVEVPVEGAPEIYQWQNP